ncbi:flagellar transcriptional regulator FlhC [Ramlibacter sp.]|uniref:flagellar transcriptional regulator FlhC n=1 Tax=Ramlibacter sp. TaxID=1917967 RepID=UPI003D0A18FD
MTKSLVNESTQVARAIELIGLGARMAVLQGETSLSHERLVRLYKEVTGRSPSKGQLPYSTDWFTSWQPNIHSSLFLNIHEALDKSSALDSGELLIKSWRLYGEEAATLGVEPALSITRAWRLVKFVDSGMLCLTGCAHCGGRFVTHTHEYGAGFESFVCGLCKPPARAGKSRRPGAIH